MEQDKNLKERGKEEAAESIPASGNALEAAEGMLDDASHNMAKIETPAAVRNYKDTVFRMLFQDKEALLSLYNALNGTVYQNPEELEIVTLDNAIYMTMKNDLAFLLDCRLSLYEQQSTGCPNMPLRSLLYIAKELEKLLAGQTLYSSKRVRIPTPSFVVFYNGTQEYPKSHEERLSEAFQVPDKDPKLELKVRILNINPGKNPELMEKCRILWEYSQYAECVRKKAKRMELSRAVTEAVEECISKNILKEFLKKNRAGVTHMSIFEFDAEKEWKLIRADERELGREEGREEGKAEGKKEGRAEGLEEGRAKGKLEGKAEGLAEGKEAGRKELLWEQIIKKKKRGKSIQEIARELEEAPEVIEKYW